VRKRLGGRRCDAVLAALADAERDWFDPRAHESWIATLLLEYYDRLYRKAFAASGRALAFRGEAADVVAHLRSAT